MKHQAGVSMDLGKFGHELASCVGEVNPGDFHDFNLSLKAGIQKVKKPRPQKVIFSRAGCSLEET
jgi:hypothetical protein